MKRRPLAFALLLGAVAAGPAGAQGWFWLRNETGEAVVALRLAPEAEPAAAERLAEPLAPAASRVIELPRGTCRVRLMAVLGSGRTIAPPSFDACRDGQLTLRPDASASPAPPDAAAQALLEQLRQMRDFPSRGIRPSPAPGPAPGIEPISPWGVLPPDTGRPR